MSADALLLPPQAIDAEQSVLGGLLLDNAAWTRVADVLTSADFYRADHRLIYEHIGLLLEVGEPADVLTVADRLDCAGKLADCGGQAYIGGLSVNTPSEKNILRYASIVKDRADRRRIVAVGQELADNAHLLTADIATIKLDAVSKIEAATETMHSQRWPAALDLRVLATRTPVAPTFVIEGWMPCGYATLFAGHGGAGKSAIALQLAVCMAAGVPFCGLEVSRRRVLYLSCEDRESILHWRLARICEHLAIDLASLGGWLDIIDLVGQDAILWDRDPRTGSTITSAYGRLATRIADAEVLIVDGITDTFAGNENARAEVKRFVNGLMALIPADTGAVLFLGHVAKPSTNGTEGQGYSGSTGWHNSVRARWYLYPEIRKGDDGERAERTGKLILELQKANHGETGAQIEFEWDGDAHMFVGSSKRGSSEFDRSHRDREEQKGILLALKSCAAGDKPIIVPATMQGPRTAFHVLCERKELPDSLRSGKPGKSRFWKQIERLRQCHAISEVEYRRSNRHYGNQFVLTTEGMRQCAA